MAEFMSYDIFKRTDDGGREKVGRIDATHAKTAFLSALFWIKGAYKEEGIEPPAFDADPLFFAEADPATRVGD